MKCELMRNERLLSFWKKEILFLQQEVCCLHQSQVESALGETDAVDSSTVELNKTK